MVCIPTDAEILAFTSPPAREQERQDSIISGDGSFCARRFPACHAFPPAYRIQIVGFVCYSDGACVQITVIEFLALRLR